MVRGCATAWAALLLLGACSDESTRNANDEAQAGSSGDTDQVDPESGDGDGDGSDTDEPPPEVPDEPTLVPEDVTTREATGWCEALLDGERLVGVGTNAELWIAADGEAGSTIRVVAESEDIGSVNSEGPVRVVSALDGLRGSFATEQGLFTVDGPRVDTLAWPIEPDAIVGLCGDLSVDGDGRVLADGDVYTRDLGQWWRWNAPAGSIGPDFIRAAGVCADRDDTTYVLNGGVTWRVRPDFVATLPAFADAVALAADESFGLAAAAQGDLWIGDAGIPETWLRFSAGEVDALQVSDGVLFVRVQDRVFGLEDGEMFAIVDPDEALDGATFVGAAAGRLVTERDGEVCVHGLAPTVSVRGVRPFQRVRAPQLDLDVADDVAITLDGEPVDASFGLGDEGWHDLAFDDGTAQRTIAFEVERLVPATYEDDIVPLFEAHCSGAGCHSPAEGDDDRPDFSTYEGWLERADSIRERVSVTADMPPPGSSVEPWGVDEILLLLGWLDAGLPEGE